MAQFWGWKWIFWLNLPLGLIIVLIVFLYLGPGKPAGGKIDFTGGLLLAAGLALFSLGISQQASSPRFWLYLPGFIAASFLFFTLFVLRVVKVPEPLFKLSMFRSVAFSIANLTNLLIGGALIIAMVNIPLMSDTILGTSPLEGGLRLLRLTIMLSAGAIAGGFLCKRFGYRLPTIVGLVLSGIGFFLMSRWTLAVSDPRLTLDLAVSGLGFGLVIAPLGTAVLDAVGEGQKGIASSLVVMMRMTGMIIGLSAITAWGMDRFHLMTAGISLTEIMEAPQQLTDSLLALFTSFFLAAAGICLAAVVPALWLRKKGTGPTGR
ncbi:MAG: hypothetical protein A2Z29_09320 [Chloroflexi bacterium RBG_16_56_11]|nr:MAG: hypothetical protein A2Z29_09320 [Chloroflexi bacterium RBG_16_56_11]